ncbi:MAG: endonuclease/exonuclease/phosphatase family protein [Cytophagales bacterium]|nr:endonuclease/exonuclease/phosphatase family protein [Cytophagales bacterium]
MKIIIRIFFMALFCMAIGTHAQHLTVATYNLRYSIEKNHKLDSAKGEDWARRGQVAAAQIRFHEFEIFGTQECLLHQLEDLSDWLPNHNYVGVGRDDGDQAGEHAAIFYDSRRFRVIDKGDFWLSETPDRPSKGWDATCCNRLCSWAKFEDSEFKNQFYVFNAHFDHQGINARKESGKLILKRVKEIAGEAPVIVMGDLNGDHDSEWYKNIANSELFRDAYVLAEDPYAVNGSFNGFGRRTESKSIIDHVFVTKQFQVEKWGVLTDTYHGKFPSDHFPVMVRLKLNTGR